MGIAPYGAVQPRLAPRGPNSGRSSVPPFTPSLAIVLALSIGCGARVAPPPPLADSECVQRCQAVHAVCIQSTNVGRGAYGDGRAALVGGLISLAMASSARNHCADVLRDCYATCGQTVSPEEQQQRALAELCNQLECSPGSAGGWIGKAGTLGREVGVVLQLCKTDDSHVSGEWGCAPIMQGIECVSPGGPLTGALEGESLRMVSQPLPGGRVDRCEFTARSTAALTLEGDYVCTGNMRAEGRFIVARCP